MELGLTVEKLQKDSRRIPLGGGGVAPLLAAHEQRGAGELAEQFFASLGVTEDRYKAIKQALHLDPLCGCKERKVWLNKLGDKLGVNEAAAKMADWMKNRK